jgi:hypothetical protein
MELLSFCISSTPKTNALALAFQDSFKSFIRLALAAFDRWRASSVSLISYMLIVGGISVYDIYLTIRYAESLEQYEANPIGRWLMGLDQLARAECPDVSLFIGCKTVGTLIVLAVLAVLVMRWARLGHPIAMGVSLFQISLGYFLTFTLTTSFK